MPEMPLSKYSSRRPCAVGSVIERAKLLMRQSEGPAIEVGIDRVLQPGIRERGIQLGLRYGHHPATEVIVEELVRHRISGGFAAAPVDDRGDPFVDVGDAVPESKSMPLKRR